MLGASVVMSAAMQTDFFGLNFDGQFFPHLNHLKDPVNYSCFPLVLTSI
jgi:hypothetical protein